jgi:GntR family transcriptional regulator
LALRSVTATRTIGNDGGGNIPPLFSDSLLTNGFQASIVYLTNQYIQYKQYKGGDPIDILISNSSGKPIYEQICQQIKTQIMDGTLTAGEALPSMRALAKELHLSVITVQRAYEDLTRDGFIETVSGKGSFVAAQNREFIREERLREAEALLQRAAELGRSNGIPLEKLTGILALFYEEGD